MSLFFALLAIDWAVSNSITLELELDPFPPVVALSVGRHGPVNTIQAFSTYWG
ncbi:MAG: hypothetical protein MUO26_09865 [Methanotrichaceae archaeon]|nr:hypothetical protein [Methanotrichaceae archaeon]